MEFDWTGKTILVAEDQRANILFIRKVFEHTKVNICHVPDGSQAVAKIRAGEDFDLVLMDIYMPVMDGYEAAREIHRLRPDLPVVAQTYTVGQLEEERLQNAQFAALIRKPININKMLAVVDHHLKSCTV